MQSSQIHVYMFLNVHVYMYFIVLNFFALGTCNGFEDRYCAAATCVLHI